ncbi:MAG: Coenzyme F420 hydrogenase/dehydrogenase, beta subunit C-terminal domain [Brevefilum sp.]
MTLNPKSAINISSLPKEHCFGCTACVSICPLDCIHMSADHEGFNYPQVDEEVCNACRKCVSACPGFNEIEPKNNKTNPQFYGGFHDSDQIKLKSSSGGLFTAFAEHTLSRGGSVYGAVYDFEHMKVIHNRATSLEDLAPMRKSKYVQSDTSGVYEQVKEDLKLELPVLFTGTPCQVAGLHLFLGKPEKNLITIDLICHGVPSPGLFATHFADRQKKMGQSITNIDFRTKDKGWGSFLNFYLKVETDEYKALTYAPLDAYYAMFLANLSLRPVCYNCKYASTDRVSDITLGDFWGVQKENPELFDGKGTSLILANTEKGKSMLMSIQRDIILEMLDTPKPLPPNLVTPTHRVAYRDKIFKHITFGDWQIQKVKFHIIALFLIIKNKIMGIFN